MPVVWVTILIEPVTEGQTHGKLSLSSKRGTGQEAVMLCGWDGNR